MISNLVRSVFPAIGLLLLVTASINPAAALPVPSGQQLKGGGNADNSLVQKTHGWHCRRRYGRVRHCHRGYCHTHKRVHRHRRACVRYYPRTYYGPSYYYGPGYYYGPRIYIGPRFYRRRKYRRRFYRRKLHRRGGFRRRGQGRRLHRRRR